MSDCFAQITRCVSADGGEGVKLSLLMQDECGEFAEKQTFTISADNFIEYRVQKGEIDEDTFDLLRKADEEYFARRAAMRILESAPCNRRKVVEKLYKKHISYECAREAAEFAYQRGYIDEKWQIESYIGVFLKSKLYGPRRVYPLLLQKGYSAEDVRAVLEEKFCDADFANAKRQFLLKKFGKTAPHGEKEAAEMRAALYKQGF